MSPIKGLTDRDLAFPQIGNIRKGDRSGTNGAPKDLTYFRVEFDERETDAIAAWAAAYPPRPIEINIFLPFNEIPRMWDAWCEAYTAGRMVARSDGENFLFLVDLATGELIVKDRLNVHTGLPEPHREIIGRTAKSVIKCRPVGRLKVIVPELRRLAYLVVHTTSVIDIRNISDQLEAIRSINGGRIVGIPLVLKRRPREISVPKEDGSHVRMTKWMLSIEADPRWVAAKMQQLDHLALPAGFRPALPGVTEEEIEGDFTEEDEDSGGDDQPEALPAQTVTTASETSADAGTAPSMAPAPQGVVKTAQELGGQVQDVRPATATAGPAPLPPLPQLQPLPPLRYQPKQLRSRLEEIAEAGLNNYSKEKRGLVVVVMEQALGGAGADPAANRKMLLHWLTGYTSMADVPDNVCMSLYKWLSPSKDSGGAWLADGMAAREALAAFNACQPKQEEILF